MNASAASRSPKETAGAHENASAIIAAARADRRTLLTELESKRVLAAYGIPTVETRFTVSQGNVLIIDGSNGTGCCADNAPELITNALHHRSGSPLS